MTGRGTPASQGPGGPELCPRRGEAERVGGCAMFLNCSRRVTATPPPLSHRSPEWGRCSSPRVPLPGTTSLYLRRNEALGLPVSVACSPVVCDACLSRSVLYSPSLIKDVSGKNVASGGLFSPLPSDRRDARPWVTLPRCPRPPQRPVRWLGAPGLEPAGRPYGRF